MFEIASQIFICLLLVAIASMIIGYLLGRIVCKDDGEKSKSHAVEKDRGCRSDKEKKTQENESLKPITLLSDTVRQNNDGNSQKESSSEFEQKRQKDEASKDSEPTTMISNITEQNRSSDSNDDNNNRTEEKSTVELPENKDTQKEKKEKVAPKGMKSPRDGKKDDLKRIKGIGLKIEEKLNSLGIFHYDQIASWTKNEVNWVNSFLHFSGRVEREDWISQAKILSKGGETEFAKRVDAGKVPTSKRG